MSDDEEGPDGLGAAAREFVLYAAPSGGVRVQVLVQDETVWLPQKQIAELFAVTVASISRHLKNIFESSELLEKSVVTVFETTAADGKAYRTRFYNLDAIIAVGYRVNSFEATQFRMWATRTLREYLVKGFVLDDERLKRGTATFGKDYFDELLERIIAVGRNHVLAADSVVPSPPTQAIIAEQLVRLEVDQLTSTASAQP